MESTVDVKKTVRVYILVFVSLLALTLITVGVSLFHLPTGEEVAIAMAIAIAKGTLVALYFMHLISEKKVIYLALIFTVTFFFVMMFLPLIAHWNQQYVH